MAPASRDPCEADILEAREHDRLVVVMRYQPRMSRMRLTIELKMKATGTLLVLIGVIVL